MRPLEAADRQAAAAGCDRGDLPCRNADNTDLEHKLKRYGKEKIICVGLLANTCLEATARIGMELGFM